MASKQNKEAHPKLLSEDEKRLVRMYGSLPHGGGILRKQSQERRYFDSGDFALSSTNSVTDDGAIKTGTVHPLRESISHPYAAVPHSSNVNQNASEDPHALKDPSKQRGSLPHSQPDFDANSHKKEGK